MLVDPEHHTLTAKREAAARQPAPASIAAIRYHGGSSPSRRRVEMTILRREVLREVEHFIPHQSAPYGIADAISRYL